MPSPQSLQAPFIHLPSVESTNNYAMASLHEGLAQHGMAVFTDTQTAGRGQREKTWVSEPGANVALSLIVRPALVSLRLPVHLSILAAVGLHKLLSFYVPDELSIKWPNDLYFRDRKAAGILIENKWVGSVWEWAVVGMGVNVNQVIFAGDMGRPVSLKQITGKSFEPLAVAMKLRDVFMEELAAYTAGSLAALEYYQFNLFRRGIVQRFRADNVVFDAKILRVDEAGRLVVLRGDEEVSFQNGEVEYVMK